MLEIINPTTCERVDTLVTDTPESIANRLETARAAQSEWAARALDERIAVLVRFADAVATNIDELAPVLTAEMGKPITQARNELRATPDRVRFFTEHGAVVLSDEVVLDVDGTRERIEHEPLGVVANVSAWNYPWFVGTNVIVPALMAGNSVLYKPSEHATKTGLALGRLLHEAGVPEDAFQVVIGGGDVGSALVEADVDGVYFTGSYGTGRKIHEALGGRLIPVQLELGGKDPAYVMDDVDVAWAAQAMASGAFYNAGQSCCAVERIYVHRAIYDAFVDHLTAAVEDFVIGDPMDDDTFIGPLARAPQLSVLDKQVSDALHKGATAVVGGQRLERRGFYFAPTVLVDVDHEMTVMREETFGPIIGVMPVDDDDEAVALMKDTEFGLTAAVYGRDKDRAEAVLRQVPSGSSYWNCCDRVSPRLPWSGRGRSGLGLTLSKAGILTFTQPRAWHMCSPG